MQLRRSGPDRPSERRARTVRLAVGAAADPDPGRRGRGGARRAPRRRRTDPAEGHRRHRVGREDELDRRGHRVPRPDRGAAAADRGDPQGHRDRFHRRDGAGPDPVHPHRRRADRRQVHRQHRPGAGRGRRSPRPTPARSGPSIRAVAPVRDGRRRDRRTGVGRRHPRTDRSERAGDAARDRRSPSAPRCCWPWSARSPLERRLRRRTMGLSFPDLRALYEQREAVLHSIGEGLLVFDTAGRVEVVNDEARRLLSLPPGPLTRAQLPGSLGSTGCRRRSPTKPTSPPTGCCW